MALIEFCRRWFRFRTQTLLLVFAILAVPLAWVAKERRQSRLEMQVAEQLRAIGFERIIMVGLFDSEKYPLDQQGLWRDAARHLFGERIVGIDLISWAPGVHHGTPRPPELVPVWAQIKTIPSLAGLTRLQLLSLCHTGVTDLTPIAGLENLRWLDLDYTPVSDLTPLAGLKNLEGLDLRSTQVTDLTPLADLNRLEHLSLNESKVTDLSPIAGLKSLKDLFLDSSAVTDLGPLTGLKQLERLDATHTQVSDLRPLADLTNLRIVNLSNTKVNDLTPLAGIADLYIIAVVGCPVTKEQVEALKKALPECNVSHTPLP